MRVAKLTVNVKKTTDEIVPMALLNLRNNNS